jgi:hypothetical protein
MVLARPGEAGHSRLLAPDAAGNWFPVCRSGAGGLVYTCRESAVR